MRDSATGWGLMHWLNVLAAFVTVAFGLWHAAINARAPVERAPVEIDGALSAYRNIRVDLPSTGHIGFLPVSTNPTLNAANHYIAQYALAPRIVVATFDGQVRFVVSGVNASAATDTDPRLAQYELAGVRDMGVRIFRRTSP